MMIDKYNNVLVTIITMKRYKLYNIIIYSYSWSNLRKHKEIYISCPDNWVSVGYNVQSLALIYVIVIKSIRVHMQSVQRLFHTHFVEIQE